MSHVTCHMSHHRARDGGPHVTCHMSHHRAHDGGPHVTCHMSHHRAHDGDAHVLKVAHLYYSFACVITFFKNQFYNCTVKVNSAKHVIKLSDQTRFAMSN